MINFESKAKFDILQDIHPIQQQRQVINKSRYLQFKIAEKHITITSTTKTQV